MEEKKCLVRVAHGCVEVLTSHVRMDPRRAVSTSPSFWLAKSQLPCSCLCRDSNDKQKGGPSAKDSHVKCI